MMTNEELMKLFDFVLESQDITLDGHSLFNRDLLVKLRSIIRGKIPNYFVLTKEQVDLLIKTFINSGKAFDDVTPLVILNDLKCIKHSLNLDINSANFLGNVSDDVKKEVLLLVLSKDFVINANTPEFLLSNYDVCKHSILINPQSANYVSWLDIPLDKRDKLVEYVMQSKYEFNSDSCSFLKQCIPVVLKALKKDINNAELLNEDVLYDYRVFSYLILNDYNFSRDDIKKLPIGYLREPDVMKAVLNSLNVINQTRNNNVYVNRVAELYCDSINIVPTIENINKLFSLAALSGWQSYVSENQELYQNVFGKICAALRSDSDYDDATIDLEMLSHMENMLGDKYSVLESAMKYYHENYHSYGEDRIEKIKESQDTISQISALYIAIAKENHTREFLNKCKSVIQDYFKVNIDHPHIKKKITQRIKLDKFKLLYYCGDDNVKQFIDKLHKKYEDDADDVTISLMIGSFIRGISNLADFSSPPHGYYSYIMYERVEKLVNRLNSGYIKYSGIEMKGYTNYVYLDDEDGKYYIDEDVYAKFDLPKINEYKRLIAVFELIKKDIIEEVNKINIEACSQVTFDYMKTLRNTLPFNDEYFVFDRQKCMNLSIDDLYSEVFSYFVKPNEYPFVVDELYEATKHLILDNYLIWLLIFIGKNRCDELEDYGITGEFIVNLINNIGKIVMLSKSLNYPLNTFDDYSNLQLISREASTQSVSILGRDFISKLLKYEEYNDDIDEVIDASVDLLSKKFFRDKSTVPYIEGEYLNYRYSMYDSQDVDILLCGYETDSCFAVGSNDNDFLHYCSLHKDGFVIRLTNTLGEFIGKASGFRNGNCVYINQLRTIYDDGNNEFEGNNESEKQEIIQTFKQACQDIVRMSYENKEDTLKIDYVFVTKSYFLDDYPEAVSDRVCKKIGDNPMNTNCPSWYEYVNNTQNLDESNNGKPFYTDFGSYPIICMASSKGTNFMITVDMKSKDVPAVYKRKRTPIKVFTEINTDIAEKVNRIAAVYSYLNDNDFELVDLSSVHCIFMGDNWYIGLKDKGFIGLVLTDDKEASKEFSVVSDVIASYLTKYKMSEVLERLSYCEEDIDKKLFLK